MQTEASDPAELLDIFKRELPNQGIFYWEDKKDAKGHIVPGTRARLLVPIVKMQKAGMDDLVIKDIIISLMYTGYVEHERQVKAKTGLSVREFMEAKLAMVNPAPVAVEEPTPTPPTPAPNT